MLVFNVSEVKLLLLKLLLSFILLILEVISVGSHKGPIFFIFRLDIAVPNIRFEGLNKLFKLFLLKFQPNMLLPFTSSVLSFKLLLFPVVKFLLTVLSVPWMFFLALTSCSFLPALKSGCLLLFWIVLGGRVGKIQKGSWLKWVYLRT